MKYAAAFLVFAAAFAVGAARLGGVGWALLYPAVSFAVVAAFLSIVAVIASYVPARRAMAVDPIIALRNQ